MYQISVAQENGTLIIGSSKNGPTYEFEMIDVLSGCYSDSNERQNTATIIFDFAKVQQSHDDQYIKLVKNVLEHGNWKENRTGVKTKSVFGAQMRFDLRDGTIPLLTTKKMHLRSIIYELLWYLQGTGDTKYLHDNNVTIWDEWIDENGQLGPVYGVQWRRWNTTPFLDRDGNIQRWQLDQIDQLIGLIIRDPDSRRMLVTSWNPEYVDEMALPPCHYSFQCYVANGELSMILNQRSCDVGLGVPFNIVQYSLLLRMLAEVTNLKPGEFIWNGGDVHIYENHVVPLQGQILRDPNPSPTLKFARSITDIDDFKFDDFIIENYNPHAVIKMDVAK
jgi:thymidylate synthase